MPSRIVLLAAVLLGWAAGAPARSADADVRSAARVVRLTIHHSQFSATNLEVAAGRVTFIVRNTDPIEHELIIGDRATQDRHETGTEQHHDAPGEITIPAGGAARTTYTFSPSQRTLFGCHLPGHWAYGMHGTIQVWL